LFCNEFPRRRVPNCSFERKLIALHFSFHLGATRFHFGLT
jgi:hypothetical protein